LERNNGVREIDKRGGGLEERKNLTERERVGDGKSVRGREGKTKRGREGKI
jgi:hypothetical protein